MLTQRVIKVNESTSSPEHQGSSLGADGLGKVMAGFRTVLGHGQNLRAVFGHQDRMFELSGDFIVAGTYRPAIIAVTSGMRPATIDHGLDGKAHPGVQAFLL